MPRRCYRKRCVRRNPHAFVPSPRPCLDSLHLPLDFYLPHHMYYPPPCYHAPIIRHEYICECPDSATESSHSSSDCMADNQRSLDKYKKRCPGSCTPSDDTDQETGEHERHQGNQYKSKNQRQVQIPYTPSVNQYAEQPPQYHNDPETSRNDRQKYGARTDQQQVNFEDKGYAYPHPNQQMAGTQDRSGYSELESYPRRGEESSKGGMRKDDTCTTMGSEPGTYNSQRPTSKNIDATFNQSDITPQHMDAPGQRHFQCPPPQYTDTIDVSLPHYSFPSSCCKISTQVSNAQKTNNSERTPSPQSEFKRYQDASPDPVRRLQIDSHAVEPRKSHDSGPSPCCANAFSRKKNDKPPVPKGMSGAHRPGYVFNEDERRSHPPSNKGCMSSGTGCSHGITSIMPNVNMPQVQSKSSTCSCKDVTGKPVKASKKSDCKKEAGTDVCHSATCLANKNRFCSCRYPPAFKQFSCSGNITGSCTCNEQNFY